MEKREDVRFLRLGCVAKYLHAMSKFNAWSRDLLTLRRNTTSELVIQLAVSCMISNSPFPAKICISSAILEAIARQASSCRGSGMMTSMGFEGVSYR